MRSSKVVNTPARESNAWAQTPWRTLERYVFHLQKRIYRARQRGDWKAVQLTRTMLHDKATHVEEPCAVKIASTVLKPSGGSDTFA